MFYFSTNRVQQHALLVLTGLRSGQSLELGGGTRSTRPATRLNPNERDDASSHFVNAPHKRRGPRHVAPETRGHADYGFWRRHSPPQTKIVTPPRETVYAPQRLPFSPSHRHRSAAFSSYALYAAVEGITTRASRTRKQYHTLRPP